ncbi:hypothetical protein MLD38_008620 [Melastoma candidum]|uniref:Uncharacterized protein n=1 Tax=Melastoma candidum TaxID=119954 RepID=A0ACB9RYL0_9MYRT|nr:hypothetical protein MLD38_008620 [Melastoma candidum]
MDAVVEGLWRLADYHEKKGEVGKVVKCLEAICQGQMTLLPVSEVKTRIRLASILLKHTHNVGQAKSHLDRSHLLLSSIPSCFDLKFKAFSLLSHCYHLVGAIPHQKQILTRAVEVAESALSTNRFSTKLWSCNFYSQLANAFIIEGDYQSSISVLERGLVAAAELCFPELEMFFATSMLHVHLMQWEDEAVVARAVGKCDEVWASIQPDRKECCLGLMFYNELLHAFYYLRICDYKGAAEHVEKLDAAMNEDLQRSQTDRSTLGSMNVMHSAGIDETASPKKLDLALPPMDGEWLPRGAVYALIDLMVVHIGRPKGLFKDCNKRIASGMTTVLDELAKLGITNRVKEVDLQHSAIWMAGVYLMLLMQFLESKVAVELTRSEFIEAQEALIQMKDWFMRFPTILQACESIIQMLRGQYAHSVGCYSEAAFHYIEAAKLTESRSMQAMWQVYAAVSYISIGDSESSSQALELVSPIYRVIDSFVGVREKTCALFAHGLLLMKQQDLQEARNRLARGLQITHSTLGNLQLVAQYLTILGNLALALHDTGQAREILRSALTLARKLFDIPTQIWVLSVLTTLYEELGERGNLMENTEYQRKKSEDLQKRLADAHSSMHHIELVEKVRIEAQSLSGVDARRMPGESSRAGTIETPASSNITTQLQPSTLRFADMDSGRRGKRRFGI